jgi:hypothetical protein
MAGTDATEDRDKVASHTLAQLRANGKKLDTGCVTPRTTISSR